MFVNYPQKLLNVFSKNIFLDEGRVNLSVHDQLWKGYQICGTLTMEVKQYKIYNYITSLGMYLIV